MDLIRQTEFFQLDRDLHAIRRRQGIELQTVRMIGGPTLCDAKGGEIGHIVSWDTGVGRRSHQPMNVKIVGAKKPKARSAAPIAPNPTLSQTSAVISVMIAADASTIAIWVRPLPSS
jgi:hypothetical protein